MSQLQGLPIGRANCLEEKGDLSVTGAINLEAPTTPNSDPLESEFDKWQKINSARAGEWDGPQLLKSHCCPPGTTQPPRSQLPALAKYLWGAQAGWHLP